MVDPIVLLVIALLLLAVIGMFAMLAFAHPTKHECRDHLGSTYYPYDGPPIKTCDQCGKRFYSFWNGTYGEVERRR